VPPNLAKTKTKIINIDLSLDDPGPRVSGSTDTISVETNESIVQNYLKINEPVKEEIKMIPIVDIKIEKVKQKRKPERIVIDLENEEFSSDKMVQKPKSTPSLFPLPKIKTESLHEKNIEISSPVIDLTFDDDDNNSKLNLDLLLSNDGDDEELMPIEKEYRELIRTVTTDLYKPLVRSIRSFEIMRALGKKSIRCEELIACISLRIFHQVRLLTDVHRVRNIDGKPVQESQPCVPQKLENFLRPTDEDDKTFQDKIEYLTIIINSIHNTIKPLDLMETSFRFLKEDQPMSVFLKGYISEISHLKYDEALQYYKKAWNLSNKTFWNAFFRLHLTRLKAFNEQNTDITQKDFAFDENTANDVLADVQEAFLHCARSTGYLECYICCGCVMMLTENLDDIEEVCVAIEDKLFRIPGAFASQLFNHQCTPDQRWRSYVFTAPWVLDCHQGLGIHILLNLNIRAERYNSFLLLHNKISSKINFLLIYSQHLLSYLCSVLQSSKIDLDEVMLTKLFRVSGECAVGLKTYHDEHVHLDTNQPQLFVIPYRIYQKHLSKEKNTFTQPLTALIEPEEIEAAKKWVCNDRMMRSVQKRVSDLYEIIELDTKFPAISHKELITLEDITILF